MKSQIIINILVIRTKKTHRLFNKLIVLMGCIILASNSYSQNSQQHLEVGQEKMKLKDINGAIKSFDEAIKLNPDFEIAIMNRAVARMAQGNWNLAIPDCDKAIRLNPNQAVAYFIRGSANGNLGKNGCADLIRAQELGYKNASIALKKFCNK